VNIVSTSGYLKARTPTPAYRPPEPSQTATQSAISSRPQTVTDRTTSRIPSVDASPEVRAILLNHQEAETPSVLSANDNNALDNLSVSVIDGDENKNTTGAVRDTNASLADGLSVDGMMVRVSGTTAVVSFPDGSDQITLNLGYGSVTLTFADGTTAQIMAVTPSRAFEAAKATDSRGVMKLV
jgi:hypothetical protein